MAAPLMISRRDDDLVGVARRSDPLGVPAVWSARARVVVPYLTEQTTDVRGFQILIETFRLWTILQARGFRNAEERGLGEFFMLVEQAFARTIGWRERDWPLPGARRVRGRLGDHPCISVDDGAWHLLGGQLANGVWGLYRGAARRAGLLDKNMVWLSEDTHQAADATSCLYGIALERLLELVGQAMDGETVELPIHGNDSLYRALCRTFDEVPLKSHLRERLIDSHDLNRAVAEKLVLWEELNHRMFLQHVELVLEEHRPELKSVIDCENLLAVLEGVFYRLCASRGQTIQAAADSLPVDLGEIEAALHAFAASGATRFDELDTSSPTHLVRSVLSIHKIVCDGRGRAAWVWEEQGRLQGDVDAGEPSTNDCQVGVAWRNDYYLHPLRSIAGQLNKLGA